MKRDELNALIKAEVRSELKRLIPAVVKPLVQEAVVGALANLLIEGVVKGPPVTVATPTRTTQARAASREVIDTSPRKTRAQLTEALGYGDFTPGKVQVGGELAAGLAAMSADEPVEASQSILDASPHALEAITTPDVADALTRDYSGLIQHMIASGKLSG